MVVNKRKVANVYRIPVVYANNTSNLMLSILINTTTVGNPHDSNDAESNEDMHLCALVQMVPVNNWVASTSHAHIALDSWVKVPTATIPFGFTKATKSYLSSPLVPFEKPMSSRFKVLKWHWSYHGCVCNISLKPGTLRFQLSINYKSVLQTERGHPEKQKHLCLWKPCCL